MNRPSNSSVICVLVGGLALCAGCALPTQMTVHQPGLVGPQSNMQLQSKWAYFACDQDEIARLLLAYPLPGARRGEQQYFVYMRFATAASEHVLDTQHPEGLSGFFEQVEGRYAGITQFETAQLSVQMDAEHCRGEFVAVCEDGTGLRGRFDALRDDWAVQQYESELEPGQAEN